MDMGIDLRGGSWHQVERGGVKRAKHAWKSLDNSLDVKSG